MGWAGRIIDTETRWEQARWLLHDDTIKPEHRVTGLLVLLYAQWPAAISRLTLDQIHTGDDIRIHLGSEPVVLPEPLAGLVRHVATTPPSATLAPRSDCFPVGNPDAPSAPTAWPNDSASSESNPDNPAPLHCSNSPPTRPPRCSPACSASTSALPSPGSAPAAATGPPTPPTSAAGQDPTASVTRHQPDIHKNHDPRPEVKLLVDYRYDLVAQRTTRSTGRVGTCTNSIQTCRSPRPACAATASSTTWLAAWPTATVSWHASPASCWHAAASSRCRSTRWSASCATGCVSWHRRIRLG